MARLWRSLSWRKVRLRINMRVRAGLRPVEFSLIGSNQYYNIGQCSNNTRNCQPSTRAIRKSTQPHYRPNPKYNKL